MIFCALNTEQHKNLYKLIYKTVLEDNNFNLVEFSNNLYNKIFEKTNNKDLALTYISYVPAYTSSLQSEDKNFRSILKASNVDANEILDKIDEWENNLSAINDYLGLENIENNTKLETPIISQNEAIKIITDNTNRTKNKLELFNTLSEVFNLPEIQASAVSEIYDRVSQTYANRNNTTPDAFYESVSFKNATIEQLPEDVFFSKTAATSLEEEKTTIKEESIKNGTYLKAPNGKNTLLSEDNWLTVQTPTFKKWFGKSNAIDQNGEPQVFYHGTLHEWDIYDNEKAKKISKGLRGQIFLSPIIEFAEDYTFVNDDKIEMAPEEKNATLMQFFAKTTKTFDYENEDDRNLIKDSGIDDLYEKLVETINNGKNQNWDTIENPRFQKVLQEKGFDGFHIMENGVKNLAVYNSNQIKDASGRNKTFYENNPNIYLQNNNSVARAAVQISEDGQAIIYALTNPTVASPLHELAHIWERQLNTDEKKIVMDWAGQEGEWTRETSELFARGFEKYLADGDANNSSLQIIFDRFKQWLADIYKGIFGSEIDLELNESMRAVYSNMLGTDYKQKTLDEINAENDKRSAAEKLVDKIQGDINLGMDYTKPIPIDSTIFWGHLSSIQQAFINKKYDILLQENKITEQQLRDIISSTDRIETEGLNTIIQKGLSQVLVDQAMFRYNHPELIEDVEFWQSKPIPDSEEFDTLVKTVQEIIRSGALLNAVENDIIEPEAANNILLFTNQFSPAVTKAIKERTVEDDKQEELTNEIKQQENIESIRDKAIRLVEELKKSKDIGVFKTMENEPLLNMIAQQAQDIMETGEQTDSNNMAYDSTVRQFGEDLVLAAIDYYNEKNGLNNILEEEGLDDASIKEANQVQELPDAIDENDNKINVGDIVDYKGTNYQVEEIIFGETPADNLYLLDNDGGAKFIEVLKKVQTQDEFNVDNFGKTNPNIFREIDQELTEEDTESDKELLNYAGLKTLLERLKNKFGGSINYEVVSTDEDFLGRFKEGIVQINLKKYDRTTPFHEYLHPFIEVLKIDNPTLYTNLVNEFGTNEEGKQIIQDVKNNPFYADSKITEIGDEALVRYLSKKSAENINKEGRRIEKKYTSNLNRLVDKFKQWFAKLWSKLGGMVVSNLNTIPITANLQDIVDMVSLHDLTFDLSTRMELIKQMDKYQVEVAQEMKTYEGKIIDKIKRKLNILEDTGRRRLPSDILSDEVRKLRGVLKNPDEVLSVASYMKEGFSALDFANTEFNSISKRLRVASGNLSTNDLKQISKDLEVIKTLITFYSEAEQYFNYTGDDLTEEEYNMYSRILNKNKSVINRIQETSLDIVNEWLYPYVERFNEKIKEKYPERVITKEKFRNSMRQANGDIDQAFFLLGSISSSKDNFSAVLRSAMFDMMEENHIFETGVLEDIKISYDNFLKKTGLSNSVKETNEYYKRNFLRKANIRVQTGLDENKNPIFEWKNHWAFHQKYFYDLFDKDRIEFMESIKFDETNQEHIDKLIAWEEDNSVSGIEVVKNSEGEDTTIVSRIPADRYLNPEYIKLENDSFYKTLINNYNIGNGKLGNNALKYGIVPQVSKGKPIFADYKDKSPLDVVKLVGSKALNYFIAPKVEESTESDKLENLDGSKYKGINAFYTKLLEENDLDLTLPETVAKFSGSSNLTTLKQEFDPLIRVTKSLLEDNTKLGLEARKISQVTTNRKTIFDKILKLPANKEKAKQRLNQQMIEFINDVMYGESSFEEVVNIGGRAIDLNKLGNNWSFLTALNNMALNINGSVINLLIGKAQLFIESTGGRYFTMKDYTKAEVQYSKNMPTFIRDSFDLKKSMITAMGIKYDAIQGEFRDKFGKKFVGNMADRFINTDTIFLLNHIAEHEIQLKGMLALMNATKLKTNSGETISLYDAHFINKDGFLRLREDIQWSKQQELDFIKELHGVNKRLNGNYSTFDKATMQRRWYGKLVLIYRKVIYTGFRNRFTKEYDDYEVGRVDFGYQRKFFNKLYTDMKEYKFDMARRIITKDYWKSLSEDERYAYTKTLTEYAMLGSMMVLAAALAHAEADDKDSSWGKKMILLYAKRFTNDLGFFTLAGLPDAARILQNPSAIMVTMSKYIDFFGQLFTHPFETYKRKTGVFDKGTLKLKAKFYKSVPMVNKIIAFLEPDSQLAYFNLKPKNK